MAIVIKDNDVEVFAVSDEGLQLLKSLPGPTAETPSKKEAFELYKLEYERCSKRYDDLYNAAWTNFSYIALIAGAILTFASDRFMPELAIALAALPLVFWWLASFEPLNRYGDQVQARLVDLEDLVDELFGFENTASKNSCSAQIAARTKLKGLRHYQQFHERRLEIKERPKFAIVLLIWILLPLISLQILGFTTSATLAVLIPLEVGCLIIWIVMQSKSEKRWPHVLRVRFIVRVFAGAIIVIAACSAYRAYTRHQWWHENYIQRGPTKSDSKLAEGATK